MIIGKLEAMAIFISLYEENSEGIIELLGHNKVERIDKMAEHIADNTTLKDVRESMHKLVIGCCNILLDSDDDEWVCPNCDCNDNYAITRYPKAPEYNRHDCDSCGYSSFDNELEDDLPTRLEGSD